ncbi:hypothetical protein [Myxococcus fulvus]|uniref:hypothetical protein n=1 Tax=Myxococcus fulvus TaxID=33 RepID=UPI0020BE2784|nr:hypothetical protein [Myxococcus fulvus]MCK8501640.1 hypothetical protein [Myxococcus fulvus]
MPTDLTRLRVSGFRSLREVELRPGAICVLVDTEGTATRDFVHLFELLRALAEGQLQRHLREAGGSPAAPGGESIRLQLGLRTDDYGVELRRTGTDTWRVCWELADLLVGLSALLVDPDLDAPREESSLAELAPQEPSRDPPAGTSTDDLERWYVGNVLESVLWEMRCFLRGVRVEGRTPQDVGTLVLFQAPDADPPPAAIWDTVQRVRETSRHAQVLLCTASESLAEAFDPREVLRVTTHDGSSRLELPTDASLRPR